MKRSIGEVINNVIGDNIVNDVIGSIVDELPLDIIISIVQYDETLWYLLYLHNDNFRRYAVSRCGILTFVQNFTKISRPYDGEETRLMGYLHSVDDKPSKIFANFRLYHYRNKLNRANDLPTLISATSIEWHVDDELHRIGAPAYISHYDNRWFENGVLIKELHYNIYAQSNMMIINIRNEHGHVISQSIKSTDEKLVRMDDVLQ